ncbi:MAG TPA: hypothetical protein VLX61_02250 [Anaerolineales bacterium]|nr:hypothetical protein [Anaerolineales bacterium]
MPRMDIQSGFIAIAAILVVMALISIWSGIHDIQSARRMTFFRLRRQRIAGGWRLLALAVILVLLALALPVFGEPIAYQYFPPSPTITLTPSITLIPTVTLTPSITSTPSITVTPAQTATFTPTTTPALPVSFLAMFQSSVTPDPKAVFSPLVFCDQINNYTCVNPETVFQNPFNSIYATYTYANMLPGVQWTALWFRDGQLVCFETHPFHGGTGGYDDASCDNNQVIGGWQPGNYEIELFVGEEWKVVGRFIVRGNPLPSATATVTTTPTRTPRPTGTP